MSVKISTIIPIYNDEKNVESAIKSVIDQNYDNFQLILIDDGSTDNSLKICEKYQSDKILVLHKENGGLVSAYKYGLMYADGDYIAFCDSDDCFNLGYFERAKGIIDKFDPDFISFGIDYVNESELLYSGKNFLDSGYYDYESVKNKVIPNIIYNETKKGKEFLFIMNRVQKIYKRSLIAKFVDDLNEDCCQMEDNIFTVLSVLNANSLYVDNGFSSYKCFVRENSMSRNISLKLWDKYLLAIKTLEKILNKYNLIEYKPQLELLAFDSARHTLRRAVNKKTEYREVKKYFSTIADNEYLRKALVGKRISDGKNKILRFLLKYKLYYALFLMLKII